MASQTKNMTARKPGKLILSFALPLMLGNVFQQLYTVVDTMVVGKYLGVNALAALGAADWMNWMMLGIVQGFTQGFGVIFIAGFTATNKLYGILEIAAWAGADIVLVISWFVTVKRLPKAQDTTVKIQE